MATVAKVAVQAATYAIDKVYDYLLPPELAGQVGCRVLVPFGRGNRLSEAVILSLRQEVPDKPLKAVRTLLDEEPILTEKELRLTLWMTRRYFCTFERSSWDRARCAGLRRPHRGAFPRRLTP